MAATLKQSIANRLNALHSTGPKSPEGKARSSRNALTHGLSRLPSLPTGGLAEAIADRKEQWRSAYNPEGTAQEWLFDRLVGESVRLDFCERRLLTVRAELADQAAEGWDADRAAAVAELADRLSSRPASIQPKLLQSRHGVLWMIERWAEVADSLRRADGWTPATWDLAMDLLGLTGPARVGSGPWDLDPEDRGPAPGLDLVRRSIEALRNRLSDFLDARDAQARLDAEAGLPLDEPRQARLIERYARDARRQFSRWLAELRRQQGAGAEPSPGSNHALAPAGSTTSPAPPPRPVRSPGRPAPEPGPTPRLPEPVSPESPAARSAPAPAPAPAASPLSAMLRDRLRPDPTPLNRRARRALAASRRS
jgi:hypothetical protein